MLRNRTLPYKRINTERVIFQKIPACYLIDPNGKTVDTDSLTDLSAI